MRRAVLLVLLALGAGCVAGDTRSNNRSSLAFLGETFEKSRADRRKNLRATLPFAREGSVRRRRESLSFGARSAVGDPFGQFARFWRGFKREIADDARDALYSMRFGLLDRGD